MPRPLGRWTCNCRAVALVLLMKTAAGIRLMRQLGKLLQIVGLVLPPLAIVMQLMKGAGGRPLVSVGEMLVMLVAGVSAFWLGRIVEGYSAP